MKNKIKSGREGREEKKMEWRQGRARVKRLFFKEGWVLEPASGMDFVVVGGMAAWKWQERRSAKQNKMGK